MLYFSNRLRPKKLKQANILVGIALDGLLPIGLIRPDEKLKQVYVAVGINLIFERQVPASQPQLRVMGSKVDSTIPTTTMAGRTLSSSGLVTRKAGPAVASASVFIGASTASTSADASVTGPLAAAWVQAVTASKSKAIKPITNAG